MDPRATSGSRAAVVARARFIEDLVAEQADRGVTQYVVPGAGLGTFARRRPADLVDAADRPGLRAREEGARASGPLFISFCTPRETPALAQESGFRDVWHVPGVSLAVRHFAGRTDGLHPSTGEDLVVAAT
ncbi:class I SAM-dependent methyltransferase [Streptomyces sp. NPDC046759]|uniref:class I SAM-dependent methyltransferase n=1 Tax=Streptomyces sp. NPDC046759 TaxID=3155019 RepID=UPI0033DD2EE6